MQTISVYPVALEKEEDFLRATFRDLPQILTWGKDESEALEQASDALEVMVASLMDHDIAVPLPSPPHEGERLVSLPAQLAVKLAVWRAFREAAISKAELARRMGVGENEVRRILDPGHATKLDRMTEAALSLGKRIVVGVE